MANNKEPPKGSEASDTAGLLGPAYLAKATTFTVDQMIGDFVKDSEIDGEPLTADQARKQIQVMIDRGELINATTNSYIYKEEYADLIKEQGRNAA